MSARFLLIDLESMQPAPTEVETWIGDKGSAWVFHGPHQLKMLPKYTVLGERVTVVPISRPGKNSLDFHLVFYLGYLTARNPDGKFAVLSKDTGYDPAITHARTLAFDLLRVERLGAVDTHAERPAKVAPQKTRGPTPKVAPKKVAAAPLAKVTPPASKKVAAKKVPAPNKSPLAVPTGKASPASAAKPKTRTPAAIYRDVLHGLRTQTLNRPKSRQALERHVQTHFGTRSAPDKVRAIVDRLFTVEAVRQEGRRLVYFPSSPGDASSARTRVSPPSQRAAA